jgi:hypothetical protein
MNNTFIRRGVIWSVVILLCFSVGVALAEDTARNYADCLAHKPSCDANLLTPTQARATIASLLGKPVVASAPPVNELQGVAQAEHDNNLRNCKLGFGCNRSLLHGSENDAVTQAEHDNNLRNCKLGFGCNRSLLHGSENDAVTQAEHDNNLRNCKLGFGCNRNLLHGSENDAVTQAEHDNNLRNCKLGFGCNRNLLHGSENDAVTQAEHDKLNLRKPEQTTQVHEENLARNYAACSSGIYTCNPSLLTPEQTTQISGGSSNGITAPAEPTLAEGGVAENGSYYGELNANGVPKTVHVDGYTRKDGTYVRGYYRSAPNSNTPGVRSGRR